MSTFSHTYLQFDVKSFAVLPYSSKKQKSFSEEHFKISKLFFPVPSETEKQVSQVTEAEKKIRVTSNSGAATIAAPGFSPE